VGDTLLLPGDVPAGLLATYFAVKFNLSSPTSPLT
jgi:hypothetical protein